MTANGGVSFRCRAAFQRISDHRQLHYIHRRSDMTISQSASAFSKDAADQQQMNVDSSRDRRIRGGLREALFLALFGN